MTDEIDMSILLPPSAVKANPSEIAWVDDFKPITPRKTPSKKKPAPSKEVLEDFLTKNPNLTSHQIRDKFGISCISHR